MFCWLSGWWHSHLLPIEGCFCSIIFVCGTDFSERLAACPVFIWEVSRLIQCSFLHSWVRVPAGALAVGLSWEVDHHNLVHFQERYVHSVHNFTFLFLFYPSPTSSRVCPSVFTHVLFVIRSILPSLPAYLASCTAVLIVSKLLAVVTSRRVQNIIFHLDHHISYFKPHW